MGGPNGDQMQSLGWLHASGATGWKVVGLADLDLSGKPDIIWPENSTARVAVWYMAGSMGNLMQSLGWINTGGAAGWRALLGN